MSTDVRRGRPRPQETIERDELVLSLIVNQPLSRNQIVTLTGVGPSRVWLSLNRLREKGLAKICASGRGYPVWTARTGDPCP